MARSTLSLLAALLLGVLAGGAGPVGRVAACSCMALGPAETLAIADLGFVGVVAGTDDPVDGPIIGGADPVTYTFFVEEALKGDVAAGEAVLVTSARDGAACGQVFGVGQRWRVLATGAGGRLRTGSCSGNQLLAERAPIPAIASSPASPAGVPLELLVAFGAAAIILGAAGVAFVWRGEADGAGGATSPR
jgi:hypothetical protein